MKRILSFLLVVCTCIMTYASEVVTMTHQTYQSSEYYQGAVTVSLESTPQIGDLYRAILVNATSPVEVGELHVSIVDQSAAANYWSELTIYQTVCASLSEDPMTDTAYFTIANEVVDPLIAQYTFVVQAYPYVAGVESFDLTIEQLDFVVDEDPCVVMAKYPESTYQLTVGDWTTLSVEHRNYVSEGNYTWSSSDEAVATVTQEGVVSALAEGTTDITYIDKVGESEYSITRTITVSKKADLSLAWNESGYNEGKSSGTLSDHWQGSDTDLIKAALEKYQEGYSEVWKPVVGDVLTLHIQGIANYTGDFEVGLVDEREIVSYWAEFTNGFVKDNSIVEGEEFEFTIPMEIVRTSTLLGVAMADPHLVISVVPENGSDYGTDKTIDFYLSDFSLVFEPSPNMPTASDVTYCVGDNASALTATASDENGVLTWYTALYEKLQEAPVPSTEEAAEITYYVTQTIDGEESSYLPVIVTVQDPTRIEIVGNETVYVDSVWTYTVSPAIEGLYTWTIDGEDSGTETSLTGSFDATSTHTIQLTITSEENTCVSTAEKSLRVKNLPSVTFAESEYTITLEGSAYITPVYSNIDNFSNAAWKVSDYSALTPAWNESQTAGIITARGIAGDYTVTYSISYTDTETYLTEEYTASAVIHVADVEVSEIPTVSTAVYTYCIGEEDVEQLSATASEDGVLHWYGSDAQTELESAPKPSTAVGGVYQYFVSQTVGESEESAKVPIVVTVKEVSAPSVVVPSSVLCYGSGETLYVQDGASVEWYLEGESVATANTLSVSADLAVGTYKYTVYAVEGTCKSEPVTIAIEVVGLPTVSIQSVGEMVENETISFSVENTGDTQWYINTILSGSLNPFQKSFETAGDYEISVVVVDENGCQNTAVTEISIEAATPIESIVCTQDEMEMYEGENVLIEATVTSVLGGDYTLVVSDESKAEVVDKMVTAIEAGEIEIYAIAQNNEALRDTIHLTIHEFISAKELSLPSMVTIKEGSDTTLTASVLPSNASYTDVVFLEKDDDYITVTAEGKVTGKTSGTSIVTASTKEGLQAQTLVYVTTNDVDIDTIKINNGVSDVYLKIGESYTVPCKISPATIKANDLKWSSGDSDVVTVSSGGLLTAHAIGETFIYISYKTTIDEKIKVFVTNSVSPTITHIPDVAMQQGSNIQIDLSQYVSDDSTAFADLLFDASENEHIAVSVTSGIATVEIIDQEFLGNTSITLYVTDEDNLTSERSIAVSVTEKENEAPVVVLESITVPYGKYVQVILADIATDDYTASSDLQYSYEEGDNIIALSVKKGSAIRIMSEDEEWSGESYLIVTVTDGDGMSTEKNIPVIVQSAENTPPVISEIPTQHENDTVLFSVIELSKYVTDDYTSPSSIVWTASTSENVSVKISGTYAEISDLNEYWRGAEVVTFTAMDQGGLSSSIDVTFYRETQTTEEEKIFGWYGTPQISIITSRYYGTPGDTFTLIGTFYGSDCSGMWEIEGRELEDPNALIQTLVFDETGYVDVTFTVMNGEGSITTAEETLGVLGIEERKPGICIGASTTLTASEGMDSYEWSTGETSSSITVDPLETQEYTLLMKKGLTILKDTITLRVSVPVSLPEDSVMCAGSVYELQPSLEYEVYTWSTNETSPSIQIPAEVAEYSLTTVDDLGCESTDSYKVLAVNALPELALGEDTTLCDKQLLTLDGGIGYQYAWTKVSASGQEEFDAQTITLDSSAYVTLIITDNNQCQSFDTIDVTFTYPYPEEIGVVTFSETSNNIIVAWSRTADVNTKSYEVQRLMTNDVWEAVGEPVPYENFGIVVDEASNYERRAYKYRLETTDACGNKAYSGEYRSSFLQESRTTEGKVALNWWTYQSPREGNVLGSYLLRQRTDEEIKELEESGEQVSGEDEIQEQFGLLYECVDSFETSEDYVGWTDTDELFKAGDALRIAFTLDEVVYENAIKDVEGTIIEYSENKAESGPFSLAISNIAEVESADAIKDIFPADIAVYPTCVKDFVSIAIASNTQAQYTIEIVNMLGQIVASTQTGSIVNGLIQIPVDDFHKGVYTVRIIEGEQVASVKIVK